MPTTLYYFYRFANKNEPEKRSNIFHLALTTCGLETVSNAAGTEEPVTYELGTNVYTAGLYIVMADEEGEGFANWFTVDASESSPVCSALSYSLETKNDADEFKQLEGIDKAEIIDNKYLQINLKSVYEETIYLTATSKGGKAARRELIIKSVETGPAADIPEEDKAPIKPCSACANEKLSKICVNSKADPSL